jgi:aminocarboxymuconate-semialdehyde decarboxylase
VIIDHQAHWYPRTYLDAVAGRARLPRSRRIAGGGYEFELAGANGSYRAVLDRPSFFDIDEHLLDMDAHDVRTAVISPNLVGDVSRMEIGEATETAQLLNEEAARAQAQHPGRIAGLCVLPMQDTAAALKVLEHAVGRLDLRGVCMLSNIAGRPLTTPSAWPVFERIDQLGLPVFLHPASTSMLDDRGLPPPIDSAAGWMYDTTAAALAMIFSGLLDRYQRLEIIHPHLGGVLPYILGRVAHAKRAGERPLQPNLGQYLKRRCYADTCGDTQGAPALALSAYGVDRMLFATDFPWHARAKRLGYVRENVAPAAAVAILERNRVASLRLPGPADREGTA